ncbi:arsenate reductase (glutaredoxin) [Sediminitomix flava]|uniref:Arsenate reductase n=1 Tax=Sediminitomix flava TaxID=379075 RepID=A0A315ZI64_SEDFL|nr:arsenate reductase (glutaredoxin) [Sediminitomix flava]PWJ44508.1 arsenate reductase [Sediminitomix flava]
MKILHNPRCTKSRQTLALIQEKSEDISIIEYLKTPPTRDELKDILKKLDMNASQIIRKGETIFKESFKGKDLTEDEWLDAMVEFPKLIERPIVIKGDKAVIGRPPENVLEIL